MAELTQHQRILFRHPKSGTIETGLVCGNLISYIAASPDMEGQRFINIFHITEWCDASEAWNALTSQKPIAGNFEWSHPEN